ncbi:MAG: HicB family protein [Candidatus Vogelbacteria bacterium CG10_big_fil_rev_8_21_14_0_10_45_14]|uniref:HicB family protein n=1 Tax=Candidatus Vogelbacteria bacterium CG10_big_fil_rev_8_21_14_0_10_45_14 TaxID=1975042 RepID=A0A2H0RK26_9BACT|nr:MAG: HicB family protein [Candidatus Vogelbacteria bacterium CG10_big_fil_rev_8_21_14_0_10_45_14]
MSNRKVKVLNYTVLVHPADEGGFWAEVPALPGCFTQGETIEEIMMHAREAIECFVSGLIKDGGSVPVEKSSSKQPKTLSIPLSISISQLA